MGQASQTSAQGTGATANGAGTVNETTGSVQVTGASAAATATETVGSLAASGVSAQAGATVTETTGSVGAAVVLTNTGQAGATTGVHAISTFPQLLTTTQASGAVGAATASQGAAQAAAVSSATAQHAAAAQGVGTLANTGAGSQEGPLALILGLFVAAAGALSARPRALWRRFGK